MKKELTSSIDIESSVCFAGCATVVDAVWCFPHWHPLECRRIRRSSIAPWR